MQDYEEASSAAFAHSSQEKISENNINSHIYYGALVNNISSSYHTQSTPYSHEVQDVKYLKENLLKSYNDEVKMEKNMLTNGNDCNLSDFYNISVCGSDNETEYVVNNNEVNYSSENRDEVMSYNATFIHSVYDSNDHNNLPVDENDNDQHVKKVSECVDQSTNYIDTQSKNEDEMKNNIKSFISPVENSQEALPKCTEVTRKKCLPVDESSKKQSVEISEDNSKLPNDVTDQSELEVCTKFASIEFSHRMLIEEDRHDEEEKSLTTDNDDQVCPSTNYIDTQSKNENKMKNNIKSFISPVENSQEALPKCTEVTRKKCLPVDESSKKQSVEISEDTSKLPNDVTDQSELEVCTKFASIEFSHRMLIEEDRHDEEEKSLTTDNDDQVCPVSNENNSVNTLPLRLNKGHEDRETLLSAENSKNVSVLQEDAKVPVSCIKINEYLNSNTNMKTEQNVYGINIENTMRVTNSFEDDFKQTQQTDVLDTNDKNNNKKRSIENENCSKEAVKVTEIVSDLTDNILDRHYHNTVNNDVFIKETFVLLSKATEEKYKNNFISLNERNCNGLVNDINDNHNLPAGKKGLFNSLQTGKIQNFINSELVNSNEIKPEILVQDTVPQLSDIKEPKSIGNNEVRLNEITEQNENSGCNEFNPCYCENVVTTLTKKTTHDVSFVKNEQKTNGVLSDLSTVSNVEDKTVSSLRFYKNTENKTSISVGNSTVPDLVKENRKTYQFTCNGTMKDDSLVVNSVIEKTVSDFILPVSNTRHDCWDTLSSSSTESDIASTGPIFSLYNKYNENNKCIINSDIKNEQFEKTSGTETMFTAKGTEKIVNKTGRISEFNSTCKETHFCSDDELEIAIKKYENYTKDDGTQTDPLNISYLFEHKVSLKRKFPGFLVDDGNEFEQKHICTKILNKDVSCACGNDNDQDFDDNDDFGDTEDVDMDDFEGVSKYGDDNKIVCQIKSSVTDKKIIVSSKKDNPCTEEAEQIVPVTSASASNENKLLRKVPIRVGLSRLVRPKKLLHYVTRTLPCED